jgi:hypothetical protein
LISRPIANSTSMRFTVSIAIGPFCSSPLQETTASVCQQPASVIGPGWRRLFQTREAGPFDRVDLLSDEGEPSHVAPELVEHIRGAHPPACAELTTDQFS